MNRLRFNYRGKSLNLIYDEFQQRINLIKLFKIVPQLNDSRLIEQEKNGEFDKT